MNCDMQMASKGILLVISGPAGSGKGTVCTKLLEDDHYRLSVSLTTRKPRPGEINGVHYWFVTEEEFLKRIANDEMLEYNHYCGNYYGTPKKEAEETLATGKNLILEIDINGGHNVKKKMPGCINIMLLPPSLSIQSARLRGRGTETEDNIKLRLDRTREEIAMLPTYDYLVYNPDNGIEEATEQIKTIVKAESMRVSRHPHAGDDYLAQ